MQPKSNIFIEAGPLLLVLLLDGMGLGLLVPILNGLLFDPASNFLTPNLISSGLHNVIYGLVIGIFMLFWFFGAAILGDLSDKIGRKKALLICLTGAFFSYLLSAIAIPLQSLSLLLIGRVIAGLTSGSQPIAQAAIIDLSDYESRAKNIGYILLSLSAGFIVGPLLGGILSDSSLVSWFNYSTPLYFTSIISFINIILLSVFFKETFTSKQTTFQINLYQAIHLFVSAFKNDRVKNLSIVFFVFLFGWSSFYSFCSVYVLKMFNFTPTQVSLYMAAMGIGFGIGNGFLVNYLAKMFSLYHIFIYTAFATAFFITLMLIIGTPLIAWLVMAPLACTVTTAYTAILTIFSNQVDDKSQGWVMGITGSIMAFNFALTGIFIGFIAAIHPIIPIVISASFLAFSVILAHFMIKHIQAVKTQTS
jgi:MFS transporter, DHA1 family, tetracycline resistance protein